MDTFHTEVTWNLVVNFSVVVDDLIRTDGEGGGDVLFGYSVVVNSAIQLFGIFIV